MGLYTKLDKQLDSSHEVVSRNMSLPKQNFCLKILVFLFFIFNVFVIIR